uniref:Ras modification protein ERF4 n=1 Tax=Eubosmina coregoni TaxID=186181 RepID=A0A4Y7LLV3_9CRUS|nr:EOG090X0IRX [Eubosmina coregoni]SVE70177.1 EOG090X0IRX [Eubosmina coregoni]
MASKKKQSSPVVDDFSLRGAPCPPTQKVFIQRDYSEGTQVRFQAKFPTELEGKIEREKFEYTLNTLNEVYTEAEKMSCSSCCEGCFACLTAYLLYCCTDTHYEKCLKKVAKFIVEQNERVYVPRGLLIIDPVERGLRVIEICIFSDNPTSSPVRSN